MNKVLVDVVLDLQQGDSGKGKIVNHLLQLNDYSHCIRWSGSDNCGHTVYKKGKKIVTHALPTSCLVDKVKSIIGPNCVVNPKQFYKEIKELQEQGFPCDNVFIDKKTHIITKEHLAEDAKDSIIGTTKKGTGPAYRDKYGRTGLQAQDCLEIRKEHLIDLYNEVYKSSEPVTLLAEGAQGTFLDPNFSEFYPYVTSGHCTIGAVFLNGISPRSIRKIYGVGKCYETYVGAMKFQGDDPTFNELQKVGGEFGATTGRKRQVNWINYNNLVKAITINGVTDIILNKLDVMRDVGVWKMIVGKEIRDFNNEETFKYAIESSLKQDTQVENIIFSENKETI